VVPERPTIKWSGRMALARLWPSAGDRPPCGSAWPKPRQVHPPLICGVMWTRASTMMADAFRTLRSGTRLSSRVLSCLLCGVVFLCTSCKGPEPFICGDEVYRAGGFCRDRGTGSPLAGVIVSYLEARADSSGFHFAAHARDTTDAAGHYWIRLDFWLHGALGFQKPGFRPDVYDVCEGCLRASSDEDHELSLDVLLQPIPGTSNGATTGGNWGQHNIALRRPAGAASVNDGRRTMLGARRR
jgi:hypothetical protein